LNASSTGIKKKDLGGKSIGEKEKRTVGGKDVYLSSEKRAPDVVESIQGEEEEKSV